MKLAGSSPGDALGASGQLNKVETAERRPGHGCGGPGPCVARKRLPVESQPFGNRSPDVA